MGAACLAIVMIYGVLGAFGQLFAYVHDKKSEHRPQNKHSYGCNAAQCA
jgi:hypothetical protein